MNPKFLTLRLYFPTSNRTVLNVQFNIKNVVIWDNRKHGRPLNIRGEYRRKKNINSLQSRRSSGKRWKYKSFDPKKLFSVGHLSIYYYHTTIIVIVIIYYYSPHNNSSAVYAEYSRTIVCLHNCSKVLHSTCIVFFILLVLLVLMQLRSHT